MRPFSFYTDPEDQKFMTLAEVTAGVQAIKEVAQRYPKELQIDHLTQTEIVVTGDHLTESFRFQPTVFEEGAYKGMFFLREYNSCTTNHPRKAVLVKEMLDALLTAVDHKLCIHG